MPGGVGWGWGGLFTLRPYIPSQFLLPYRWFFHTHTILLWTQITLSSNLGSAASWDKLLHRSEPFGQLEYYFIGLLRKLSEDLGKAPSRQVAYANQVQLCRTHNIALYTSTCEDRSLRNGALFLVFGFTCPFDEFQASFRCTRDETAI